MHSLPESRASYASSSRVCLQGAQPCSHRQHIMHVGFEGRFYPIRARAREGHPHKPEPCRVLLLPIGDSIIWSPVNIRLCAINSHSPLRTLGGFVQEPTEREKLPSRRIRISRRLRWVTHEQHLRLGRNVSGGDQMFLAESIVVGGEPPEGEQRGYRQ